MPTYNDGRGGIKLSFADVFKSSRTIREEIAAVSYKRAVIAARAKKAAADLASRNANITAYPPSLPPGFPPLVYVPVRPNPAITTDGSQQTLQCPPQCVIQHQPQPPNVGKPQSNQAGSNGSSPTCTVTVPAPAPAPALPQQDWTTDDDDMLRQLKAQDMTWKSISVSMGRPVSALKNRWGIIRPAVEYMIQRPHTMGQGQGQGQGQDEIGFSRAPQPGMTHRRHERRVSFSEPLVVNGKNENYTFTRTPKKKILYIDENFSFEEILLLNKLAMQCDEEKWLRISSRFFDKTGKRLTPQEAKEYVQNG
ncbi:uncharacterized protein PADG_02861 [Paracoccidioides brasiliensis Pb18]|uniref:Myb-like domain-containing protein n=1 Tax=Paracoccidioides brasiliensis (strain Pb18) TaxID=502780 RepID=C1G6Q6_PARBD|nr:uncharacterized protein PADG_02861 [Paracoccidioides brasiliensis Pb18]EEH46763.2 hypothetical protein PADG_02861 [Paracoccidioides brasiliensis Pb18]